MTNRTSAWSLGAVLFVVAVGHLMLFPKVADLDGFYHVGHAEVYTERGIFDTSLPWATQSVIADRGADLWWGFHMVLTPFTLIEDVAARVQVAAPVLTLVLALTVAWVLRRHGIAGAGWWTALFLVAVPNVFFRYLMVRPHVLSLAASLALASLLVRGRWWQVALVSGLLTWLHLSLFWMAWGLVAAYAAARLFLALHDSGRDPGAVPLPHALGAVLLGTLAGWLLRPHPLATAELLSVQLFQLFAVRSTGQPLTFAVELSPIPPGSLVRTTWLFLGAWTLAGVATLVAAVRRRPGTLGRERRTLLVLSLLASVAFFALALLSARRALVQWTAFGFLALPLVWSHVLTMEARRAARSLVAVLLVLHVAWALGRHRANVALVAFPGETLAEAAAFLEASSRPGEVVFHARWDNFGPLFARNRTNLYLSGMDPIFQLAHDPRRYWEFFYLSADVNVDWTCDAFPCAAGTATDVHEAIRDHFGARWVLVEPRRNPRLSLHLLEDPRFRLALETRHEAVFEVLREAPPGGPEAAPGAGTVR